ncbi:MAG: LemA family protein [bacterium]|nr:LemA family protein [bacterium]
MTKGGRIGCGLFMVAIIIIGIIGIYGALDIYRSIKIADEKLREKWSHVENVYQRRMDIIPNLVETIKGYAAGEKETFRAVTTARVKLVGKVKLAGQALRSPKMFLEFQQAQAGLSAALMRLMEVTEKYPELENNRNYMDLQSRLEATDNRISAERRRFNQAAAEYNNHIQKFPRRIVARLTGFNEIPRFSSREKSLGRRR